MTRIHISRIRYIIACAILVLLIITQTGCSKSIEPLSSENYYLDTTCSLFIYDMDGELDEDNAQKVFDDAWELCRELDKTLSKTVDVSDVSRINSANGQWVEVSEYTLDVVKAGIKYSEMSGGDFDITIGTVTDLWDYHSDNPEVPSQATIDEALSHVGYKQIQIQGNQIKLSDPKAKLDLGGIAKGYVADKLAELMQKEGVTSGIVNLGGNIVTIGCKPEADGFKIGIEKPYSGRTEELGYVISADQTIVTSGVYERQFEKDGKIYHHILSPKTGYPVETDLDAVSLVADIGHSMDIDALSTICLIKGSEVGPRFIQGLGLQAVFCKSDGEQIMTKGFNLLDK